MTVCIPPVDKGEQTEKKIIFSLLTVLGFRFMRLATPSSALVKQSNSGITGAWPASSRSGSDNPEYPQAPRHGTWPPSALC